MFYKLISNGDIIDVMQDPVWVKLNARGRIVRCEAKEAAGVVSADAETIYQIVGGKPLGGDYEAIGVADITETEYEELRILLDLGGRIVDEIVIWPEESEEVVEPEDPTLPEVKRRKLAKLSEECHKTICAGADVTLSDGSVKHFDFELEDQINLCGLMASGKSRVAYHASGELCAWYDIADIALILNALTAVKDYHTAYYNSLKNWVMSIATVAEVGAVVYGDEIPDEFCSAVLKSMGG